MVLSDFQLDTDFLIWALETSGSERCRLLELVDQGAALSISAVAWYEFSRGPRTPQQLAVARSFFHPDGVVPFSEEVARHAAETYRRLGCPRHRGNDIAIGTTAALCQATLLTRNRKDFAGIPDLELETV